MLKTCPTQESFLAKAQIKLFKGLRAILHQQTPKVYAQYYAGILHKSSAISYYQNGYQLHLNIFNILSTESVDFVVWEIKF